MFSQRGARFFTKISKYLNSMKIDQMVVTGDFNTVLDIAKDRSGLRKLYNHPHALSMIQEMVASLDLVDIWRWLTILLLGIHDA